MDSVSARFWLWVARTFCEDWKISMWAANVAAKYVGEPHVADLGDVHVEFWGRGFETLKVYCMHQGGRVLVLHAIGSDLRGQGGQVFEFHRGAWINPIARAYREILLARAADQRAKFAPLEDL